MLGRPQFALAFAATLAVAVVFIHPALSLPAAPTASKGSPASLLHVIFAVMATLLPIVVSAALHRHPVPSISVDPLECEERLALICSRTC